MVILFTEESVSAQTVSHLTRTLDQAVAQFHQAPLMDDWRYLFLDGAGLRVRRPGGSRVTHPAKPYN
ncbi:MAG TPA: transposase [Nitrospira sp.]|nr:transposase [Nitrospira sp.]